MPRRYVPSVCGLLTMLLVVTGAAAPALPRDEALPDAIGFVAMAEGRFAAAYWPHRELRGLVLRFAQGQFDAEDAAEIDFGYGYPELIYDPVSGTLLLYRGYEGSGYVVAYAPEGRELYRLPVGESGEAVAVLPGAGLLAIGNRGELSIVECRTGVAVLRVPLVGALGSIMTVTPLGDDQLLVHCIGDAGPENILLDWRRGMVLWRSPADPFEYGGPARVAADSSRILLLSAVPGADATTITSRSRRDGAPLGTTTVPTSWCWLFAVPGDPRLLLVSGTHNKPGRLQLLSPDSLAVVAEAEWPAGLRVQGLRRARDLGAGGVLLDGTFAPDPGFLIGAGSTCGQLLVDLNATPPRVRTFAEPLAVDPQGQGWLLGTRRLEVVGEIPWLEPIDLEAGTVEFLPAGARLDRREIAFGPGPGLAVRSTMRSPEPDDAAALRELMDRADLCFIGTITGTSTHCLGHEHGWREGLVAADFAVDELLWGPAGAARVYVDGIDLPGCIDSEPPRLPDAAHLVPGRRYLVVARWQDDAFVVRGRGLFALDAGASTAEQQGGFAVPEPATAVREHAARIDPAAQFERADAVVRLGAVEVRDVSIAGLVNEVYKGDEAICRVEVWAERGRFRELAQLVSGGSTGDASGDDPVLFLRSCGPGRWELLEGARSVLWRGRRGDWARPGGLREPRAAAVLGGR